MVMMRMMTVVVTLIIRVTRTMMMMIIMMMKITMAKERRIRDQQQTRIPVTRSLGVAPSGKFMCIDASSRKPLDGDNSRRNIRA